MASEIGIGAAQRGRLGSEPPGDDEAADCRRTGAQSRCRGGGLYDTGRIEQAARVSSGRRQDHCRKCRCTVKTGGIVDNASDIILKVQRVSPDKPSTAAQFPDLAHEAAGATFAARTAPTDHS